MRSLNFEFLRTQRPNLAGLAGFAEHYAHSDPSSALTKLRIFAEQVVQIAYEELGLQMPPASKLYDWLRQRDFVQATPGAIRNKLDSMRVYGNKAAHGVKGNISQVGWLLQEAFDLGKWIFVAFDDGNPEDCAARFQPPPEEGLLAQENKQLHQKTRELEEQIAQSEARLNQMLDELEQARRDKPLTPRSPEEKEALAQAGEQAVHLLRLDERSTRRRLIDAQLAQAGWDVGDNGEGTDEVAQELPLDIPSTRSGKGKADYVLWDDDGSALAVIEAKKLDVDPRSGSAQAREYADALARGGRRPVLFLTNGMDIWLWNDAADEPPRKVHGFYSKDSLQALHFQREHRTPSSRLTPDTAIVDRLYQISAIKSVLELFDPQREGRTRRKALLVQATGTGKTRVAIGLCKALVEGSWAKRILFLCDRRELRKQAAKVFQEFLPGEPSTVVNRNTYKDRNQRVYLATYPAMMKVFQTFDVGFFDLIIADESHRSIYKVYRDLFRYFDAYQVGLTATPVQKIERNTFDLFQCENQQPTYYYSYLQAIESTPPYLVPFEVESHTTRFLRDGIRYADMTPEQQAQLDEEDDDSTVDFDASQVDRQIFNKDTNRAILRNLMEHGIRDATGSFPGKTIIFARSHQHALLLKELFDEMYPQYGGKRCQVIDSQMERVDQLIDDFKGLGQHRELTIAVSVDMLDTGIDVPEVVNLVFAKPVKSSVKFWQMIGRGTRLCRDLFGPGRDKKRFLIFDHWNNFQYFGESYQESQQAPPRPLLQRLFQERIALAEAALTAQDAPAFQKALELLRQDLQDLPLQSIAVREQWQELRQAQDPEALQAFSPAFRQRLKANIAPLMQWRDLGKMQSAYQLDLLMARIQSQRLLGSADYLNLVARLQNQVSELRVNLAPVAARSDALLQVRDSAFWQAATLPQLEELRLELRGIMQYRQASGATASGPRVIDVEEDPSTVERTTVTVPLEGLELAAYRSRMDEVLSALFHESEVLLKIKNGQAVQEEDLQELSQLVLARDPGLRLYDLLLHYPNDAGDLALAIRRIIGLDAEAVHRVFVDFTRKYPHLSSRQVKFLDLLKNHIGQYGCIQLEQLYEPPFTNLHSEGVEGLFQDDAIEDLLELLSRFEKPGPLAA